MNDKIRLSHFLFSVFFVWSATAVKGGEQNVPVSASATIQATATVISPAGIGKINDGDVPGDILSDNDWLLRSSDVGGVLIQVEADGIPVGSVEPLLCLDASRQKHLELAHCPFLAALDESLILSGVPPSTDTCRVTVILIDN